uniref:Acyl-CoA thioesterase 9 n=1 Tax=Laticauda laticaudata TaxID=8630 RepID=A0A8C5WPV5_LATLA
WNIDLYSITLSFHHQIHSQLSVLSALAQLFHSFCIISFCLLVLSMRFSWQIYSSGFPFPSPVDHVLLELSTMTCLSWVTLCGILLDGGIYCPVLDATFVMVARDPENKRPAFVNPLIVETPEEEKIFNEGEKNKIRRLESSRASLLKVAPTADERNIIHNIFLNTLDSRTVSFRSRVLLPNSVWMQDTKLKGLEICHPQERNIFNRIFGGFLMRKAYELGWATAYSYGNSRPYVVAVDDIMFQKPVEIGSLLLLSSQVCYTEKNNIQVRVHSEVYDPDTKVHHTTNVFHFTFMIEKEIPDVVPKTYGESMLYLDGKRHFDSVMKENTT